MKKIIILGCPGSGKSTLAIKLHILTELPLFHLDNLYWNSDKIHDKDYTDEEIPEAIHFQEKYYEGVLLR